jgi:hypothetical protein
VETLKPYALIDTEQARNYLKFDTPVDDEVLTALCNEATSVLERNCARPLRARPHLNPSSLTCTTTTEQRGLTAAPGVFDVLRPGMLVSGTGIQAGTFIRSIESGTALTMSLPATASGSASRTFTGQGPVVRDGSGTTELLLPNWPLQEVVSLKERDASGALTSLSTAGHRKFAGILVLTGDVFPKGRFNIELECVLGYLSTDDQLASLQHAAKRLVQVMYLDHQDKIGRGTDVSIQGFQVTFMDKPLPPDIEGIVRTFRRIG